MCTETHSLPNAKRVTAGKRNRLQRKGLSAEGRERLRQAALTNQPWRFSSGPKTTRGKASAAANGKKRQKGELSVRELRAEVADVRSLLKSLRDLQELAGKG